MAKPRRRSSPAGKWVFVPHTKLSAEEQEEQKRDEVFQSLAMFRTGSNPFAAVEQYHDYFPGENKVPDGGAWILVTKSPPTQFTVPPFSMWFAEPWPMEEERWCSHRVRIITPKGELGIFPREYSLIKDPARYYEFIGRGMELRFFGNDEEGIPTDPLFYIRTRGIPMRDALAMLIAEVKCHGVMWIEARREVAAHFGAEWPDDHCLATH